MKKISLKMYIGFIKASCGCFCKSVGNWKYNYLQPNESYKEASRYVFLISTILSVFKNLLFLKMQTMVHKSSFLSCLSLCCVVQMF